MITKKTFNQMLELLFFLWIVIYSGSILYMYNNTGLQYGIYPAIVIAFYFWAREKKSILILKRTDETFVFVFLMALTINILLTSSVRTFALYYGFEFGLIFCACVVAQKLSYDKFCAIVRNGIFFIALLSLIFYSFPQFVEQNAIISFGTTWKFKSLILYNLNTIVPQRNCGAFWEPGMYQAYLVFALYLYSQTKMKKTDIIKVIVIIAALVTTFSTTGYFGAVIVGALWTLKGNKGNKKRYILAMAMIALGAIVTMNIDSIMRGIDKYTSYSIYNKFINNDESVSTRLYSGIIDLSIAVKNPFGVDRRNVKSLLEAASLSRGVYVNASTNTLTSFLLYFGWVPGIWYIALWIRGCLRQQQEVLNKILVVIMMGAILMTELHIDLLFFYIVLFYWNKEKIGEVN